VKKKSFFIKFVAVVLLIGLLAGCGKVKNLAEDTLTKFKPIDAFNIRQVITQDSATSRTVMWQSKTEEKDAFIEYRAATRNKTLTQKERINDKFTDNGKTSWVHTVTLNNLEPGTEYEYRLAHGDSRSRWYQLNTAKGNKYKALIFPDSQSADYKAWENVAMPAWKRNQDAQFFMMIGDLVDNGEHDYQWNEWFSRIQPMITRIPVATVLGNHETYTMNWQVRMPLAYLHYFQLPGGVPQKYQNQFYSFDYGDVHFVVLNNLMWEMDRFQPNMLAEQKAWFRRDMEQTKKKWKVVLMHRDIILYEFNRPGSHPERFDDEGVAFMPLFDRYGVDVVLTGHLHTYRNRGHIYNYRRDSRGPLYILTGVAGDVQSKNLWKHSPYDIAAAPEPETSNYMVMEAEDTQLKFCCYLPDGSKVDEAVVKK
jgi:predicted phosphodiesterase